MSVSKFVRIAVLGLVVSAASLPSFASATRQCSVEFCVTVVPTTRCQYGTIATTCGYYLATLY